MPEMTFTVRWPDGRVDDLYSPSLVIHDFLTVGSSYSVEDFTRRSVRALTIASERVAAKFGFACTSAAQTAAVIEQLALGHPGDALVEVLELSPPLPSDVTS